MSKLAWVKMCVVAVLGAFIVSGCATSMGRDKDVSINQLPTAVKVAVQNETAGGTIKEIEKKQCCGNAAYKVEYRKDGRKVEVVFAEDGTIMTGGKCPKCGK